MTGVQTCALPILAGNGDDTVQGGGGNDIIFGEDGNDVLNGNSDVNDTIVTGQGADTVVDGASEIDEHFTLSSVLLAQLNLIP